MLDDHVADRENETFVDVKMIIFDPNCFWVSIIKFYEFSLSKLAKVCWKRLKRLLLAHKSWMLFILSIALLIRMPEAYAVNMTVKSSVMSLTSFDSTAEVKLLPTADFVSLMKGKKPISIPENEVVTSEDSEDYLEQDFTEDYDDEIRKENESGECFTFSLYLSLSQGGSNLTQNYP